jgi:hypothetical protein
LRSLTTAAVRDAISVLAGCMVKQRPPYRAN